MMDILDIDEVLNDDSFCLMEDGGQDEVSNILRQWRQNGCSSAENKLDTRTFTRPKRRSVQNLDPNVATKACSPPKMNHLNINLKIGGLVTSMQKSFLQDTSPPSSIASSMDASIDRMGNSLINSGDFTNVSFFNTTETDDDALTDAQIAGYNFDDVIKDRQALEKLSLSGDSAIIKDCNIAQIDEITYLSKTNSGNSTMQNSTESMPSVQNDTFPMLNQTAIENNVPISKALSSKDIISRIAQSNKNNVCPSDDLICNTTISLIDSAHATQQATPDTDVTFNLTFEKYNNATFGGGGGGEGDGTFLKENKDIASTTFETINPVLCQSNIMNRTYYKQEGNETFELCGSPGTSLVNNNSKYDSPPIFEINSDDTVQSTPHRNASIKRSKVSQTPSIVSIIKEVNISPIMSSAEDDKEDENMAVPSKKRDSLQLIEDFEKSFNSLVVEFPSCEEQIENFKLETSLQDDALTSIECFENGIEMLQVEPNEEEFDEMLEQLSRSACLNENLKMRQSLDNIKKKHALSIYERNSELLTRSSELMAEINRLPSDNLCKSSLSSSSSSERLLNRRSRLYDDVQVTNAIENVNKTQDDSKKAMAKTENPANVGESKTEEEPASVIAAPTYDRSEECNGGVKITPKRPERKRDPERFRTIQIFKKPTDGDFIVPCIDDELENADEQLQQLEQATIEANNKMRVFNNNNSEVEPNPMYQTYKKPKATSRSVAPGNAFGPIAPHPLNQLTKPRSLSRPRYVSAIAKREVELNDAIPKANSATDIHRTYNGGGLAIVAMPPGRRPNNMGTFTKAGSDLMGPMGTKAKSFTNLTGGGPTGTSRLSMVPKPGSQPSLVPSGTSLNKEKTQILRNELNRLTLSQALSDGVQKNEKAAFKMPQPVSNLRAPNSRRTGLMRPSSGYYGQNPLTIRYDPDQEAGRYSSNNSLSSNSSRGSVNEPSQFQPKRKLTNGFVHGNGTNTEEMKKTTAADIMSQTYVEEQPKTAPTTNPVRTGIPKPSGLRQPSATARRSALPRPSSVVRR